jgi:hypothetical protein
MVSESLSGTSRRGNGPRGKWVLRTGAWIDRALTWGLDPEERSALLHERGADRFDHLADPDASVMSVTGRTGRSAVADVGYLILGGEATAVPVAFMFAVIGLGAFWQAATADFEPIVRMFNAILAVGLVAVAAAGLRRPRAIYRPWLLPALLIASIGTLGGAITIPIVAGTEVYDLANKGALVVVTIGFLVVAAAVTPSTVNRIWLIRGGAVLWAAALGNAIAQLGWGVVDAGTGTSRGAAVMVAVGCVAGAVLLRRLRHVPVTNEGKSRCDRQTGKLGDRDHEEKRGH